MLRRPPSQEKLILPQQKNHTTARQKFSWLGQYVIDHGAEWNYITGVPLNYVTEYTNTIPLAAADGINLGWNYLDSLYTLGLGVQQLLNQHDYRQTELKIKGVMNILSGLQMCILTYNPAITAAVGLAGGSALSGPAFMLSMACDVVSAVIDFCHAQKEVDIKRWFRERGRELAFYNKKLFELENDINAAKAAKRFNFYVRSLEDRRKIFLEKKQKAQSELYKRARVFCYTKKYSNQDYQSKENLLHRIMANTGYLEFNVETIKHVDNQQIIADGKYIEKSTKKEEMAWDAAKQAELIKERNLKAFDLALRSISFIGMGLLAVAVFVSCPYLVPVGLAIVSLVAAIYLVQNSKIIGEEIKYKLKEFGFFKSKNSEKNPIISPRLALSAAN